MSSHEYSLFRFFIDEVHEDPSKIKLLTKIYNKDSLKSELLSLVWTNIHRQCWAFGHNGSGCLGVDRSTTRIAKPTLIKTLCGQELIKLCSGHRFVLALNDKGQCFSWGNNKFGQLGLGKSLSQISRPVLIDSIEEPIVDIACGLNHALVLTKNQEIFSFGSNLTGSIGNGTTFHQLKPYNVTSFADKLPFGGIDFVEISCGGWHSAAINQKELFVWGWNQNGQCGSNNFKGNVLNPTRISLESKALKESNFLVRSIRCGQHHSLILCYDSKVYAIGDNSFGQCCRDINKVPYCKSPCLIEFDHDVDEIEAWSKSNISVAKSMKNFFIWGTDSKDGSDKGHLRKISLNSMIGLNASINWILSKIDADSYPDDNKRLRTDYDHSFSSERILIQNEYRSSNLNNLMESFNNPNESDLILSVENDSFRSEKLETNFSKSLNSFIFVNRLVLEKFENFFQKLPSSLVIENDDGTGNTENFSNEIDTISQDTIVIRDGFRLKLSSLTIIINNQRKKFQKIILDGRKVTKKALYAYLMFIYSTKNYMVIDRTDLVDVLRLADTLQEISLIDFCFQNLILKNTVAAELICELFCKSVLLDLKIIENLCHQTMMKLFLEPSRRKQIAEELYRGRDETYDLDLRLSNQSVTIKCHRLILLVGSNFYQSLSETQLLENEIEQSSLMKLDSLCFRSDLFSFQSFDWYIYHIYHNRFPFDVIATDMATEMFKFSKIFNDIDIEKKMFEILREKINAENACHFYIEYCQIVGHNLIDCSIEKLIQICMEKVSKDLDKMICGNYFHKLLENPNILQSFFIHLSRFLKH
ncbi:RCC1 and BTB domain-containing protein 2 [Sarcoptes scabiei]|nr:RCC1 and BTB domain-containing protein 2 [Sarcoptes scabiei]